MKLVLLSGGSGIRLWPLSNEQRPKQFIKLFNEPHQTEPVSMLQKVWSQLESRHLHRDAIIGAAVSQREHIREQLGRHVDLVLEPTKRDTFPAILLSVAYLYTHRGISHDETVIVLPVDGQVEDSFYDALIKLPEVLESSGANIALMGVKPTMPSEKYGYMLPEAGSLGGQTVAVRRFYEKPSASDAAKYIELGALWNCGVFCFKAGFLLDILKRMKLPDTYEELLLAYSELESRSFDYAVVEREQRITALVYEGPWKDLGTWSSLTEEISEALTGNGLISNSCSRVHIINELDAPVVVLGLTDVIVAASREGILITHKGEDGQLKDALSQLRKTARESETDSVSQSRDIDQCVLEDGIVVTTRRICLKVGMEMKRLKPADEYKQTVTWTIVSGSSRIIKNDEPFTLPTGGTIILNHRDTAVLQAMETVYVIEIVKDDYSSQRE
ncbi:sugar phosphate nucleotidyltransferase [Paenibacillus sp. UNC451MF]|uniref:sugar phosphate nucleotidyltransferase n=1 Tax=Paenibacillus sp. UNC451MF TaxID=1449063 RepID=UPI00048CAA66|nr:sugar phosphate nucleotidyltransferase [Paenibacillus sp. UNC451MF]